MDEVFQLELLRLQADLRSRLAGVHDVRKALVYGLRVTKELFDAGEGAIAALGPSRALADQLFAVPRDSEWDQELLTGYLAAARPQIPDDVLLAPVRRRGRNWAALALRGRGRPFSEEHREALFAITAVLTEIVQRVDEKRTRQVRRKIERKIADRQEPKDLVYDILHGMRSLIRYDHSAALLIARDDNEIVELVAEQIAWTKAKSRRIGLRLALDEELGRQLGAGGVHLYERTADGWRPRWGDSMPALPELLDFDRRPRAGVPPEVAMLCAPITTPGGMVGVLKISARREGVLEDYEARLIEDFVPLASLAVQFLVRTESLQDQVLRAERKHVLANLARGITHDLNNALGAVLPLVQQMRAEVAGGELRPETLDKDLESIERSLQTCRRIFGGMLSIARGSAQSVGHGNLRRAIDGALSVVEDSLKRRSIAVAVELPEELPTIHGSQGDLTQVFLNVFSNARDAMPDGGRLEIRAENDAERVRVTVADDGSGIPREALERISEPFFTTKPDGNGLGLSICRSIVWDVGGEMSIDSREGEGTTVKLSLPVLAEVRQEAAG